MPHTLLLADDSLTIRRLVELTFADEGIQVVAVADGRRAIESITAAPPDIVLADAGMSPPDGYDVAAFVKGSPALANIPVILLTAAFQPIDAARAASVGCDAVLAKPFELTQLVSRVKELLEAALCAVAAPARAAEAPLAAEAVTVPEAPDQSAGAVQRTVIPPHQEAMALDADAASLDERIDLVDANLAAGEPTSSSGQLALEEGLEEAGEARAESWSAERDGDALSLDEYFDRVEAAARGEAAAAAAAPARAAVPVAGSDEGHQVADAVASRSQRGQVLEEGSPDSAEALEDMPADSVARVFLALLHSSNGIPADGDFERIIRALRGDAK